jgi:hypothetical protein
MEKIQRTNNAISKQIQNIAIGNAQKPNKLSSFTNLKYWEIPILELLKLLQTSYFDN